MKHTKLFKSNRSQALRLPKAVAFPEEVKEVDIVVVGRSRLIAPADESWDAWFDGRAAGPDFMTERMQPDEQEPETL